MKSFLDFNHGTGPIAPAENYTAAPAAAVVTGGNISEYINTYVDRAMVRRREEKLAQEPRDYIGMSEIGDECLRKVYMKALKFPEPPMDGRRLRIFEMGHEFERMVYEWMLDAGFDIVAKDPHGQQFEVSQIGGRVKGHIDGILIAGPEIPGLSYPMLWENKGLAAKYWNAIVKHGVKKAEPKYYAQMQQYMPAFRHTATLFQTINKDTADLYSEVIFLDSAEGKRQADRTVRLIASIDKAVIPPRISANSDFFKCKMCELRQTCWELP